VGLMWGGGKVGGGSEGELCLKELKGVYYKGDLSRILGCGLSREKFTGG